MDCNKDEAIRAKQVAEQKMRSNDYEGARKIALKAQNLYAELDNISQLLSVCDVHCAALRRVVGSEKDWYGILQVEKLADESTVRKQYRRLALILHPDKNQFPGAEAAFKLICEANAVLSDSTKKNLYDTKIRVPAASGSVNCPPHHMNRNSQFNMHYGSQNNIYNGFGSLNQATQPTFRTVCPFCCVNYEYHRKYVNSSLQCPKCLKSFMAYEISSRGVPPGPTWAPTSAKQVPVKLAKQVPVKLTKQVPVNLGVGQSSGFQQSGVPYQGKFTAGTHNVKKSSAPHFGFQQSVTNRTAVQPEPGVQEKNVSEGVASATKVGSPFESKGKNNCSVNSFYGGKSSRSGNKRERAEPKNKNRRKARKFVVESSESSDSSSDSDVSITEKSGNPSNDGHSVQAQVHGQRRSARKRQNISYREGDYDDEDDDDLPEAQGSRLSEDNGKKDAGTLDREDSGHGYQNSEEMGGFSPEESVEDEDADNDEEVKGSGKSGGNVAADPIEIESDLDDDQGIQCPDPEFNDFDQDREESCFSIDQFWACYDSTDGMPRFYAKVKKKVRNPFELSITWLEPVPVDAACKRWIGCGLPVGCGSFKLGKTERTSMRMTFSHQMHVYDGKKRGSIIIHPRKGEVWALFKDWDLSWSSLPENHKEYKYEIVEVLSDFVEMVGIKVCYMDKVGGFVSLFDRSSQSEGKTKAFLIGPNELYRFSHRIPSCKMTGTEKGGVPVDSLELDPASLPLDPNGLHCPNPAS